MAMIDVSRQRRSLLKDAAALDHLPAELLEIIKHQSSTKLFDAVSEAALIPSLTERIFVHFEDVFSDICARWILNAGNGPRRLLIASAIARILPFAPYLSTFLQCSARAGEEAAQGPSLHLVLPTLDGVALGLDADALLQALLTYWRLFSFDLRTFSSLIPPEYLQSLFAHESRAVRYLAIRIFCQLFHASDFKLESLIETHVGSANSITADFDGASVDYGFLSLHEQARAKKIIALRQQVKRYAQDSEDDCQPLLQSLTQHAVSYGKIVLPRPSVPTGGPSDLVMTTTTTNNLERLAAMIRNPEPILFHGLPGVGKTALVHEMAKQLGMYSGMVTLHLNEQTDAKMLIGLYSTDSKPGSFSWRPGVLTTAIKEGRWVLVEDLDRAPTEVLSTFLPLIERNELLIPSRGERIKAANSFRLFATVRTSMGMNGRENLPSIPMIQPELEEVFLPGIIAVYGRLTQVSNGSRSFSRGRALMDRQMNLRDLLKWCRRLQECLIAAGSTTGDEPITETTRDWICPDDELSKQLIYAIAEEMHLSKERADHYLTANIPPLEENDVQFSIGRVQLRKKKTVNRLQKSKRPFASTSHAKKLLEQIAVAVKLNEPVLLVGETGIGKTTVVQQLAESLGHKLIAVNLSQQSEVGDLLGGFKPVNVRNLFSATGISASKNQKYLEQVGKCFAKGQWSRLSKLWREAPKMFLKIVSELERAHSEKAEARNGDDSQPTKRRKTSWDQFARTLEQFDIQISGGNAFAFSFVEGNLVKAVRNGDWVLLDEINLASPDTLESITDLLTGPNEKPSILLSETGEIEKIVAHPNFRIFDLPIGIRSRFTELYVKSPDKDLKDLLTIIKTYLGNGSNKNDQRMAEEKRLVDGANEVPHFSLRTLTRVLSYVNMIAPFYGLRRAMYEGFSMGFLTLLDRNSEKMLLPLIYHHLLDKHGNPQSLLSQPPKHPGDGRQYVKFQNQNRDRQYWLFQGEQTPIERDDYIITPYVERNLLNLVRATSTRRFPILIQGPTSAGKTSMIEYLANFTGNKFVRINNHEHTDLQEYLGTYISGADGKLRFQEGLLVQAMRQGHWIVLDELNLAPTDVLEALNRLLDDNRELLIPETQEVVKPHENFILFATQNPPGLYGGRKVLSRAFRNRFLELHFDDIPEDELEYILQQRSRNTSPPDCRRIVNVYKELSRLRQTSRLFEQKDSFATLRDLFRWALRSADTREEIAAHGFMLLAERVRNEEERTAVKEVIEKVFKVSLNPQDLYSAELAPELKHIAHRANAQGVVWTHAIRRLYVLVSRALQNNEPVLLVGETGCGKTTVVQLLAEILGRQLHIVNAHQNTETGDIIGSQRPIRNRGAIIEALDADVTEVLRHCNVDVSGTATDRLERYKSLDKTFLDGIPEQTKERIASNETRSMALFEWSDGALVEAMRGGHFFLLDEISLADDSVLERLNSVLEPQRTLLLAEKGVDNSFVVGVDGYQFFATMNPGGDFGKKELSPALRNRFTEIWVPPLSESDDIYDITRTKLTEAARSYAEAVVQFAAWFGAMFRPMATAPFSVREVLAWVQFINASTDQDVVLSIVHGAAAIFIDSLGANPSAILATDINAIHRQRVDCLNKLGQLLGRDVSATYQTQPELDVTESHLTIGGFSAFRTADASNPSSFAFHAPTTRLNAMRVIRAMQTQKPILLEGSPGVGKTSLVVALAQACGRPLTRINLSDQTDLMDLFGTDVPVEGEEAGNFAWRDAPFLQAMQKGEWVLLDEMNLASQSVLEGLNACLDHRGERHPNFRLFAAQNPHHQGGGRKGLPASFVNRFVVVYADVFKDDDLKLIASHSFPQLSAEIEHHLLVEKTFGAQGSPWLNLLSSSDPLLKTRHRFRTEADRAEVDKIFRHVISWQPRSRHFYHDLGSRFGQPERLPSIDIVPRLPELESIMLCVKQNIPCILSSPSGYALAGKPLVVFPMNADIDTMDLVEINATLRNLRDFLQDSVMSVVPAQAPSEVLQLLHQLDNYNGDKALLQRIAAGSEILHSPLVLSNPRFEWLDVLDNANMCNASPNGFLSINEHCGPGGEPRIVKPHPEFRIFLTMDPRHGELSRAMRNHASLARMSHVESSLQRYLKSTEYSDLVSLENLSLQDVALLPRFVKFLTLLQSPLGSRLQLSLKELYSNLAGAAASDALANAQPLHPLNNMTVSNMLPSVDLARWNAARYDTYRHLYHIQSILDSQQTQARSAKLISLNRLQRSLISDRVAAVSKDSTVKLAAFVSSILTALTEFFGLEMLSHDTWEGTQFIRAIRYYMDRTIALATKGGFDEAVFQAHLAQGTALLGKQILAAKSDNNRQLSTYILGRLEDDFDGGFKLSTGLSMESLWNLMRPIPIPDKSVLDRSVELDRLGARFDNLRWKAGASVVDLSKAQQTLEQAYKIIRDGVVTTDGLVKDLITGIESLESRIADEEAELLPFLANEFESLRQFDILRSVSPNIILESGFRDLCILSNVPTKTRLSLVSATREAALLQSMDCLVHKDQFPWDGTFTPILWSKLQSMGGVSLGSLALLDVELPAMGRHVASLSAEVAADPLPKLNNILQQLIFEVFGAHSASLKEAAIHAYRNAEEQAQTNGDMAVSPFDAFLRAIEPLHLQQVAEQHLIPAMASLLAKKNDERHTYLSALAWTHFSVGLRPKMERDKFTGQNTNERIELLKVQPVFRPEHPALRSALEEGLQDRLTARFEAYQDMTRPAANLLQCLRLLEMTPLVRVAAIFECFHGFYDEWSKKLEADRKAEETKGSIYQFRGSLEDEEEIDEQEFNELSGNKKDTIFLDREDAQVSIQNLSRNSYLDHKSYSFYTSPNLPEARQLVILIGKIKARFRELQLVDEIGHMQPLADVIQSCNNVLELIHEDPLAKILPKVEHLHAHVYAVLSLYNALTDTIVRWRRLELSTWANLFETEQTKCQEDAYSWWFIAYQVVVAVPLSMSLETYFLTSILQSHLQLLIQDYPSLTKAAEAAIQKGRASLDKKMKDVLLMASWKDTNINALRDSAKRSHQKLFRIGLPDETTSQQAAGASQSLNGALPGWLEKPSPEVTSSVPQSLDAYLASLEESMAELKKETPKRKLFADTLRDLRGMESFEAEYYFHKTLDLAPKARNAAREHSEDLTGAEVARSIGFVEGFIHFALSQRNNLASIMSFQDLGITDLSRFLPWTLDHSALVQKLQTCLGELAKLPALLTDLAELQSTVSEAIQSNPGVGFILQQLRVWSHTTKSNAKKAGAEIPRKEDEAAWLKKHSDAYLSMINQLHMKNVEKTIEQCIRALQKIDLGQPLASMAAMSAITQSITAGLDIHRATVKIGYGMTKAFTQIASQGFCTPQEKSDEKSGAEGNKDIQADEDLSELAQEANKEKDGEMEDEKDAVDMADEELEGDMNSVDGAEEEDEDKSQKGDEEEEEDAMDEEAGDMWDGDDEKAEKDQEGDKAKGQKQEDEQMATEGEAKPDDADQDQDQDQKPDGEEPEEPEAEDAGAEEEDVQAKEELNRQDQTVEENDALELPEDLDMNLDENDAEGSDEDDLDLIEAEEIEENVGVDEIQEEAEPEQEEEKKEEEQPDETHPDQTPNKQEETKADKENAAPSDVKSSGIDQNADSMDMDDEFQAKAAQQDEGDMGDGAADQDTSAGNKGATSRSKEAVDKPEDGDAQEEARSDPFKKLGDALEKWHRQQMDIKDANMEEDEKQHGPEAEEQGQREFQHLKDDEAAEDTQALGTADNEEAQPLDDHVMDGDEEEKDDAELDKMDLSEPAEDDKEAGMNDVDDSRTGVKTRQGAYNKEPTPEEEEEEDQKLKIEEEEEDVQDASAQLSTTHLWEDQRPLRDFSQCLEQWTELQTKSHSLSLSLTSQLRLILTPSQSTKLSGSFRTGKRLNIKRIIPYIASSYKRDKIWMRRSIPTKRTYQIMLCVDDSKSMGESSSGALAMESLVMVSRSLTMLEAGQVGVLGFGADVFTAHQLTDPFGSDAGAKVLQRFSFGQDRTDIALLIRQTIDTFRTARQRSSGGSDLWQLALILSDGLTPSSAHDSIRRLLREAMEERIMIVFIIMDDTGKKKGDSVLELKEAKFVSEGGESRVVIERYLDTFPFQYYLIVHNLEELPSALAGLLRTWFAEVAS
ncbi:hypothetical protein CI102_14758 [Trichoderma harzianum]|nr:hypothetical protein CI102_14758 [Trichoderma harzianum]